MNQSRLNNGRFIATSVSGRFWQKVGAADTSSNCWPWKGTKDSDGYGQIHFNGKHVGAHRMSWILEYGEIDNGLCVLHKCDNPTCVNPSHLFLGTKQDNADDAIAKKRTLRKTHCWRGHELTGDNVYAPRKSQGRQCKLCARIRHRKPIQL